MVFLVFYLQPQTPCLTVNAWMNLPLLFKLWHKETFCKAPRKGYHRIHYLAFVQNLTYCAVHWWSTRVPSPRIQHRQLCSRAFRLLHCLTPPLALQSAFLGQSFPLAVLIYKVFSFLSKLNCCTPGRISSLVSHFQYSVVFVLNLALAIQEQISWPGCL